MQVHTGDVSIERPPNSKIKLPAGTLFGVVVKKTVEIQRVHESDVNVLKFVFRGVIQVSGLAGLFQEIAYVEIFFLLQLKCVGAFLVGIGRKWEGWEVE